MKNNYTVHTDSNRMYFMSVCLSVAFPCIAGFDLSREIYDSYFTKQQIWETDSIFATRRFWTFIASPRLFQTTVPLITSSTEDL